MGKGGAKEAYRTGQGKVVVRSVCSIEEGSRGKQQIIVTEIPFQVNKAALIQKMAELVKNKQLEFTNLVILEVPEIKVVSEKSKIVSFDMDGGSGYLRYDSLDGQLLLGADGSGDFQRAAGGYCTDTPGAADYVCGGL